MLDERKLDVLRAIVEDFVSTNEPVGSKALVERHHLRVSPATIRNDMAALEEEGYIAQPHTSAGRVPTDKGYRLFVDRLSSVKPLSTAERRAIQTFLEQAVDLDDVVHRTVRLLAQVTRQVAVVQYPSLTRSTVRHVELVALSATRLLIVLITDTGRVEQRIAELPEVIDESDATAWRSAFAGCLVGRPLESATQLVGELAENAAVEQRSSLRVLAATILEMLVERPEERVVLAGTSNLARFNLDFPHTLQPVLEALEEQVVLLRLLAETTDTGMVNVRIGAENAHEGLRSTSLVTTAYGPDAQPLAALGVLGPTRMDYPGTIGAVKAVARYVGRVLAGG